MLAGIERHVEFAGACGDRRAGSDNDIVVSVQRQTDAGIGAAVVDFAIGRDGDVARLGIRRGGAGGDDDAGSAAGVQHGAAGNRAGCVDRRAFVQGDIFAGDGHCAAAFAAIFSAGVQRPGNVYHATRSTAQEDAAIFVFDAARFDNASLINDGIEQRVRGFRAQDHLVTVGADRLFIFDQGIKGRRFDADIEQSAGVGQADALARRHATAPCGALEQTLVAYLFGNQRDVATLVGIDRAAVNDAAVARAGKSKLTAACAAQKIGVGDIQRARHPSADIHLGAHAKGDAVRVDQKDWAIRQKLAKDRGGNAA